MVDVVVVGGGPVGLMLATELGMHGVSVLVCEALPEIERWPEAEAVTGRAVDILDRRALLRAVPGSPQTRLGARQRALAGEHEPHSPPSGRFPGARHFAGMRLRPEAPEILVPQQVLEQELAGRAVDLGIEVRRGHTVTGFDQDEHGVRVTVDGPGGPYEVRGSWLAGCDGGRSTVRELSGIGFPGTDGVTTGYCAFAEVDDPAFHPPGWFRTGRGLLGYGESPSRFTTLEFDGPPPDQNAPITADELQGALRRLSGTDVTVTSVSTITRFSDDARQAESYRLGRVLLVGDAAHVHSHWSSSGLRLGLGDAVNLGWKLAAQVVGWAPAGLLDTYTTERHPPGARTLEVERAATALMRPGPQVDALRGIVQELLLPDETHRQLATLVDDLQIRYDMGIPHGQHPLVGRFSPDLHLRWGCRRTRVAELQRTARPLLLDLVGDPALEAAVEPWAGRVDFVVATCADAPADALLVRADGHVAWAAPAEPGSLARALARWFGAPV